MPLTPLCWTSCSFFTPEFGAKNQFEDLKNQFEDLGEIFSSRRARFSEGVGARLGFRRTREREGRNGNEREGNGEEAGWKVARGACRRVGWSGCENDHRTLGRDQNQVPGAKRGRILLLLLLLAVVVCCCCGSVGWSAEKQDGGEIQGSCSSSHLRREGRRCRWTVERNRSWLASHDSVHCCTILHLGDLQVCDCKVQDEEPDRTEDI